MANVEASQTLSWRQVAVAACLACWGVVSGCRTVWVAGCSGAAVPGGGRFAVIRVGMDRWPRRPNAAQGHSTHVNKDLHVLAVGDHAASRSATRPRIGVRIVETQARGYRKFVVTGKQCAVRRALST
jgi:hypothetical protein